MGTRGLLGFVVNDKVTGQYNQFDTYPEGLGMTVIDFIKNADLGDLRNKAIDLIAVKEDHGKPASIEIEKLKRFADTQVSSQDLSDWYCLLRNCQGDIALTLESGYILDQIEFARDSLFCEYGYFINLDKQCVEFYEGFQEQPHRQGRFADQVEQSEHRDSQYYPIALVGEISFEAIKDLEKSEVVEKMMELYRKPDEE